MVKPYIMTSLDQIFPKARAELFTLLFVDPGNEVHLRAIADSTGFAIGTIQQEVAKLENTGLLASRRDGNRRLYRANRDHPLYPEIHRLVQKTSGMLFSLESALSNVNGIQAAFVFGSFAADKATSDSDIDLMVIGEIGLRRLSPLLRPLAVELSREINPHIMTLKDWKKRIKEGDAFIRELSDKPKHFLIGDPDVLA